MNKLEIKRHSFDLAKNRLKEFSQKTEAELAIDRVRTDGGFLGLGDHKVTGYELNNRLEAIQGHLIDINSTNNRTIKEFREVYNALDALDKDYITSIVANVKAIEKTSNDVRKQQKTLKQHNEKLFTQQNKLDTHQTEIDKNVENMKKIVTTLRNFKEKLDRFKHLTDIDKIWSDCKTMGNDMQVVSDSITALSKKTTRDIATANSKNKALLDQVNKEILDLQKEVKNYMYFFSELTEKINTTSNRLKEQIPIIQEVSNFVCQMNEISHLNDVDSIWEDVNSSMTIISNLENELQTVNADIQQMQNHFVQIDEFITALNGYAHLKDIDSVWNDLAMVKMKVDELFKLVESCNEELQKHHTDIDNLKTEDKNQNKKLEKLSQNYQEIKDYTEVNRFLIEELQSFRTRISSIVHISDIDSMWEQCNTTKENLDEANDSITSLKDKTCEIDKEIIDKSTDMQEKLGILETKLKYAYYIAGGALGFAVVELILALIGVI